MDAALSALLRANFDWTTHIDAIWQASETDVAELQDDARAELEIHLDDLSASATHHSPLGVPLLGAAGSGKTHVLGVLRQKAFERRMWFVLVDMTDVDDFWGTTLLGYLRSLQQPGYEPNRRQLDSWLTALVARCGDPKAQGQHVPAQRPPRLINTCNAFVAALTKQHRELAQEHADVLRALVLFACDHAEINDLGYKWLQGIGIDDDERDHHGFRETQRSPARIVRGLSWLLSLQGPTVMALDQLDAIVAEHNLASQPDAQEPSAQQQASLAIIHGIAGGLLALRDVTRRSLVVVSGLNATWDILNSRASLPVVDRYVTPLRIDRAAPEGSVRNLVLQRLARAYARAAYEPPYATYPYTDPFLAKYRSNTPREVLKACDAHRRSCRKAGAVHETTEQTLRSTLPDPPTFAEIESSLRTLATEANVADLLADKTERSLDVLIETACRALVRENPVPSFVLPQVDTDFIGTGSYDPLHARVRLILTHEGERERHHAFRFLQQADPRAFQARLKAAITASGIDHALAFRRLTILRVGPAPGRTATQQLLDEFARRGGQLLEPTEVELRTLFALSRLMDGSNEPDHLDAWLQQERPVSKFATFRAAAEWLFSALDAPRPASGELGSTDAGTATSRALSGGLVAALERPTSAADHAPGTSATQPSAGRATTGPSVSRTQTAIPIGRTPDGVVSVPISSLATHTCVLAGAGSGKTVFLRRIIEEAALAGVPSIVLDAANDLSRLGDPWPTRPEAFTDEDATQADRYRSTAEVVLFTPGVMTGNPLILNPIPEFSTMNDGSDEARDQFNHAIAMAVSSLEPLVAPGKSAKDKKARAVLTTALERFGDRGGGTLRELIGFLREPPEYVIDGFADGERIAQQIAELLLSATKTDPLLGGAGKALDPAKLLTASAPGKVRVSVINLAGLAGIEAQQRFVNQLAMTLFTHIKKHPAPADKLLGLFVIDEARDFVPSGKSAPAKDNLIRLVAQARKYGLGMLFATQAPKSIDHNIIANCSTLLVGKTNSPAGIQTIQQLLQNKGGGATAGKDVAKLPTGTFYASTAGHPKPVKIATPLCLSHHPSSPPAESEVVERARRSRVLVG
jgi:hypothetical protein